MTTYYFGDGNGPVPAHQHPRGGGWVADTAKVAYTVYIGPDAKVYGNALVYDNAQVYGNALVYNNALVYGNAKVYGDAEVSGNAKVYDNALVYGDAEVYGNTLVCGDAKIDKIPVRISRSDGYDFILVPCADGIDRVIAGCRYFTLEEAKKHWNEDHPKYQETNAILTCLKILRDQQLSTTV